MIEYRDTHTHIHHGWRRWRCRRRRWTRPDRGVRAGTLRFPKIQVYQPSTCRPFHPTRRLTARPAAIIAIAAGLLPVGKGGGASSSVPPPLPIIPIIGGGGGGAVGPAELGSRLGGGNLLAGEAPGRGGGAGGSSSSDSYLLDTGGGVGRPGGTLALPDLDGKAGGGGIGRLACETPGGGGGGGTRYSTPPRVVSIPPIVKTLCPSRDSPSYLPSVKEEEEPS